MKVICDKCGKPMGDRPPFGGKFSTTIIYDTCPDCLKKFYGGKNPERKE